MSKRTALAMLAAASVAIGLACKHNPPKPPPKPTPPPVVETPTPPPEEPTPPPDQGEPAVCAPNNIEFDGGFGCPKDGWRCPNKGEKGAEFDYVRDPNNAKRCVPVEPPPPPPPPPPPTTNPTPTPTPPPPPPPPPGCEIPEWSRCHNHDFRNDALCHAKSNGRFEHIEVRCGSPEHCEHLKHGDKPCQRGE